MRVVCIVDHELVIRVEVDVAVLPGSPSTVRPGEVPVDIHYTLTVS